MLNEDVRVANEVAAMALAREALGSELVPAVYGWDRGSGNSENGDSYVPGWALMELKPGTQLGEKFESLEASAQRGILGQVAEIFQKLQSHKLPESIKGYGGLNFDADGNIVVGATAIYGGGPCDTLVELYTECFQTQVNFADKCDVVKGWKDTDLRTRIDKFASEGLKPLLAEVQSKMPVRPTLVHGDFGEWYMPSNS